MEELKKCEQIKLDCVPTCQLVRELETREGVRFITVAPYEQKIIAVEGSMIVLQVTD